MIAACTAVSITFDKPKGWGMIINLNGSWDHETPAIEINDGGMKDAK